MVVKTSLGFSVEVDFEGKFELPARKFSSAELKKVAREVNKSLRNFDVERDLNEVYNDE